jgi:hypothetical protein
MGKSVLSIGKQITSICFFKNKRTDDKLCLHNKQTVNGLKKTAQASVLRFPFETATYTVCIYRYGYIHINIYMYIDINTYDYMFISISIYILHMLPLQCMYIRKMEVCFP